MDRDPIIIRPATADDATAAGRLLDRAWRETYGSFFPPEFWVEQDADRRATVVRDRLRAGDPLVRAVLAQSADGELVGWAMVGSSREPAGFPKVRDLELFQLYVTRPGLGLGRRLLDAVVPPRTGVQLWVFSANEGAQRFYRRHGFAPDGAHHVYREDLAGGVDEQRYVR